MLNPPKQNRSLGQSGFASIVIALVLIIVLALLTIGFAQLARREQKSALDKQLAAQAYFAAESGVNDTLKNIPAIAAANPPSNQCLDTASFSLNPVIDSTRGVSYSCVLVNLKPPNIVYDNVAAEEHRYITFTTDPSPMGSMTVSWGSARNSTTYRTGSGFPPLAQWGDSPAVLEVSLTPLGTGALQRNNLINNTFTAYAYPSNGGSDTIVYNTSSQGRVAGRCSGSDTYPCRLRINNIPGSAGQWYLLHIIGHYDPSNISVTGTRAGLGSAAVVFVNGQAQIDVTGKAREVLKRIQVRVPVRPAYGLPKYGIESQSTCKRFTLDPNTAATFDSLNAACTPN